MDSLNIAFLLANMLVLYVMRSWGIVAKQALTASRNELNNMRADLQEIANNRDDLLKEVDSLNRALGDLNE